MLMTKKNLPRLLLGLALCCALTACKGSAVKEEADTLVQIDKYTLTRSEVTKLIPEGSSPADSLLIAENYIKKWITDVLIYKVAERNIGTGVGGERRGKREWGFGGKRRDEAGIVRILG